MSKNIEKKLELFLLLCYNCKRLSAFGGILMILKLSVDRIESGIAVCYDDNDKKHELPAGDLSEGELISAEFDSGGNLLSITHLAKETENARREMARRTKNLFNRNNKN